MMSQYDTDGTLIRRAPYEYALIFYWSRQIPWGKIVISRESVQKTIASADRSPREMRESAKER